MSERKQAVRVIVRMWNAEGYHKDVAVLSEQQVHMSYQGMEPTSKNFQPRPSSFARVVIDPKQFPEAVEFEVLVEDDQRE